MQLLRLEGMIDENELDHSIFIVKVHGYDVWWCAPVLSDPWFVFDDYQVVKDTTCATSNSC